MVAHHLVGLCSQSIIAEYINGRYFRFAAHCSCSGNIIYNYFFGDDRDSMPSEGKILFMLGKIREASRKGIKAHSDRNRVNCMIAWNSRKVMKELETCEESEVADHRVAPTCSNTRAYFSHGRNCKYSRNSINDCPGNRLGEQRTEKNKVSYKLLTH